MQIVLGPPPQPHRATIGATLSLISAACAAALVACGPDEPRFGDPGGILGRSLPNEVTSGGNKAPGGVFGAPYDPNAFKPRTTMATAHAGKGGPAPADTLDCLSCHKEGGAAGTKPFSYGGRVVSNNAPAPDVDVIVIQGDEKLGPVKSDADGFFWFAGPAVKEGAKTYVRKTTTERAMGGALRANTGGSCDAANCHVPGGQGKIFI